jgi:hypothetical protein
MCEQAQGLQTSGEAGAAVAGGSGAVSDFPTLGQLLCPCFPKFAHAFFPLGRFSLPFEQMDLFVFMYLVVLGIKPRALCMLGIKLPLHYSPPSMDLF